MEPHPRALQSSLTELLAPFADGLCDACLGRLGARLGPPTGNAERGRIWREALGLGRPPECRLCEGLTHRYPHWGDLCLSAARDFEYATFLVGCVTFAEVHDREQKLYSQLAQTDTSGLAAGLPPKPNPPPWPGGEWLKAEINREVGRFIEARTGKKADFQRPDLTFRLDTRFDHVELQVADLFAQGRYRKLVRDVPQTRWPCRSCGGIGCRRCNGTGKTYETSVEELIAAPVLEAAAGRDEAFHGMGREDIDVRTLGTGRPFVLEIKRPQRRTLDWPGLERSINDRNAGRVEVVGLGPADPQAAARFKAAEPAKTYRARCRAETIIEPEKLLKAVASLAAVTLQQRTPQRVAHRRADLVRARRILGLRLLGAVGDRFELEIRAESGTYVKEFVSGDEGRTTPSLTGTLGIGVRVEELDVVDVEWKE